MLSDKQIRKALKKGDISCSPPIADIGPNSIDVRIDKYYYAPSKISQFYPAISHNVKALWGEHIEAKGHICFPAHTLLLTTTIEEIGSSKYVPHMISRSTIARIGLNLLAGLGDIGYNGKWTMEIYNCTNSDIYIPVGTRVAQIAFYKSAKPTKQYTGKYATNPALWVPADMLPKLYLDKEVAE